MAQTSSRKRARSSSNSKDDIMQEEKQAVLATPSSTQAKTESSDWNLIHFLLQTKVEQLKIKDNKIFIAKREDKVTDVWKGLLNHGFLSVPVLQKKGDKWYGFVDLVDIVHYVVSHFGQSTLEKESFDFWKVSEQDEEFQKKTVNDIMIYPLSKRNPFHPITEGYSLLSAVEAMAREPSLHRVPVVDRERKLKNVITQSRIIELIHNNKDLIGSKKSKTVDNIANLGPDKVFKINEKETAMAAFQMMSQWNLSAVAVVNDEGKLTGVISVTDLKAIQIDGRMFWRLYQTCHNFLEKVKHETNATVRPRKLVTIPKTANLEEIVCKLFDNNVHRLFVVDDKHAPIGVVSLREVLQELLNV